MTKAKLMALSLVFAMGSFGSAMAETVRQHDSHEHGVSTLKIAIENNAMQFILESPASDVIGFEHKPENSEEKASVKRALELLNAPDQLFKMPLAAACSTLSVKVEFSHEEEHEEGHEETHEEAHEEGHDEEHGETHSEFHASYLFNCAFPEKLATIDLAFFDRFPNAEEIELQAVSDFGQLSAEISRDQRKIDLSTILK